MYSTSGHALTHNVSNHPAWGCSVRLVQPCDNAPDPETEPKVYTEYDAASHTLTYYYDAERESRAGVTELYDPSATRFTDYYYQVQKIVIDPSMKSAPMTSMKNLFYGGYDAEIWVDLVLSSVTEIDGLGNLNTVDVTDMSSMFFMCEALTNLDLRSFNTSNVTDMNAMFEYCTNLQTINLTSFSIAKVTDMRYMFEECLALTTIYCNDDWSSTTAQSDGMFRNCNALVGGNGTPYDADHTDASYARPDEPGEPGYFTKKSTFTGIEEVIAAQPATYGAQKVMIDGQLYILRDGKAYNATGAEVK